MEVPQVSIVLPAYNAARFIDEAIRSIRNQTLVDWEMIVVNDGSTDETGSIADRHASEDSRIRVIHQANAGQAAANNRAISEARAEFIARMDADDVADPTRLQRLADALDANSQLAVVGSNVWMCDDSGNRLCCTRLPLSDADIRRSLFIKQRNCLVNPTVAFRRTAWIASGGERTCFGHAHDLDLNLRMGRFGEFRNLCEPTVNYRIHKEQVSIGKAAEQAICAEAAFLSRKVFIRTGAEPKFVSLSRPVSIQDIRDYGGTERDCRNAIVTHVESAHARLCLLRAVDNATLVRTTILEQYGAQGATRMASAQFTMLVREAWAARWSCRTLDRLCEALGWLPRVGASAAVRRAR